MKTRYKVYIFKKPLLRRWKEWRMRGVLTLASNGGMPMILLRRARIKYFLKHWRFTLSPFFWIWVRAFDKSVRQIDPIVDYDMSKDIGWDIMGLWYSTGITPDQAIYQNQTSMRLGAQRGARLDGHGRHGAIGITYRDGPVKWAIDRWQALNEKNRREVMQRAANIEFELYLTGGIELENGLSVVILANKLSGVITGRVVRRDQEQRPMYQVTLHGGEVIYCRAIEMTWEGRKS